MIAVNGLRSGRDHRAVFARAVHRCVQHIALLRAVGIAAVAEIADNIALCVASIEHVQLRALIAHLKGEGAVFERVLAPVRIIRAPAHHRRIPHGEAAEFLRRDVDIGADLADALGIDGGLGVVGIGARSHALRLVRGGIHILQHVVDGIVGILGVFGIVEGDDIIR